MKAVFIDESKSKAYVLCVVFLPLDQIPAIRKGLNKLRLRGQSRIHFVSESDRRRKQLLSYFRKLPIEVCFFEIKGRSEAESRSWCLQEFVKSLPENQYFEIWLETDSNHLALDKAVLTSSLAAGKKSSQVVFTHTDSRSQVLLWIPDALAWVRTRGGDWLKEFKGFKSKVIRSR